MFEVRMEACKKASKQTQDLHRSGAWLCHNVWNTSAATQRWQRVQHSCLLLQQESEIGGLLRPQPAAAAAILPLLTRLGKVHAPLLSIQIKSAAL